MSLINQANQYFQQGKLKQAEQLYRQLLQQNRNNIDALWGLGKVAFALDSYQVSVDIFSRCTKLAKNMPPLWLSLAQACEKLNRFTQTEQALLTAYELKVDYLPSLQALAVYYCQSNQLNEAGRFLNAITSIDPLNINAFCLRVRIKEQQGIDQHAQSFLDKLLADDMRLSLSEQVLLHFAFAQLFQHAGDYQQAYQQFTQANAKQRATINFSVSDMQGYFTSLMDTFSAKFIDSMSTGEEANLNELTPIFIVGQPRSGSTLLEQMLINHSEIETGGELPFLAGDIAQGIYQLTGIEFPQGCHKLTPEQCHSLGRHYLANMQTLSPKAKFIIDKMPANYQSIGLIRMLLPNAKIIHISRNVKDVIWSIFSNHFDAPEPYFCAWTDIVAYQQSYEKVMQHWINVLPSFIYELDYKSLVNEPEKELTELLYFCGLKFEECCLNFDSKQRHIATLSDVQLRSGLNTNLTKAWLPYQDYLPESFNKLN